jgi:hypothetical protein
MSGAYGPALSKRSKADWIVTWQKQLSSCHDSPLQKDRNHHLRENLARFRKEALNPRDLERFGVGSCSKVLADGAPRTGVRIALPASEK